MPGLARTNLMQALEGLPNLSASEARDAANELEDLIGRMASSLAEGQDAKEAKTSRNGKSWIMALADALGKKLDAKAKEMSALADAINDKKPSTTTKFGASAQEFSILMNAANTAIKTLGEANSATARKQ